MVKDYRILPTQEQKDFINSALGTYRFIYNRYIDFVKRGRGKPTEGDASVFYAEMKRSSIEEMMSVDYSIGTNKFRWLWDKYSDEFLQCACFWAYHTVKELPTDKLSNGRYCYITKKDTGNCGKICIPISCALLSIVVEILERNYYNTPHFDKPRPLTAPLPLIGRTNFCYPGQEIKSDSNTQISSLEVEKRIGREFTEEYYIRVYFPNDEDTSK